VRGNAEEHQFLVGTCSLAAQNSVHLLQYDDETTSVNCVGSYPVAGEVWHILSSPNDKDIFLTSDFRGLASLHKITENSSSILQEFAHSSRLTSMSWKDSKLILSTADSLLSYDMNTFTSISKSSFVNISTSSHDPHHNNLHAIASENHILIHDLRDNSQKYSIPDAHKGKILCLDFNPNNPYHLASSSIDSTVRIWDMRKPEKCLRVIHEHSHWVYQAKYNNYHDQLMVTSGSDNSVILHRVVSGSSTPMDENIYEKETDAVLMKIDDFDNTVYAVAWSVAEAWHYASLSFNGRLEIHAVPSEEKYKILL
jgi:WD40 repeat protein